MTALTDILFELIDREGGKEIAARIGVSPSKLSRFRAGKEGLTLDQLEKLMSESEYVFAASHTVEKLTLALETTAGLLSDKVRWRKNRNPRRVLNYQPMKRASVHPIGRIGQRSTGTSGRQ